MAVETERTTDADRTGCRIDKEIVRKARAIAALEDLGISEVIERDLRAAIERRFAKATNKAAAELGEAGA